MIDYTIACAVSAEAMLGVIRAYVATENKWLRMLESRLHKKDRRRHAQECRKRLVRLSSARAWLPPGAFAELISSWKKYRGLPISVPRSIRCFLGQEIGRVRKRSTQWGTWGVFEDQHALAMNEISKVMMGGTF